MSISVGDWLGNIPALSKMPEQFCHGASTPPPRGRVGEHVAGCSCECCGAHSPPLLHSQPHPLLQPPAARIYALRWRSQLPTQMTRRWLLSTCFSCLQVRWHCCSRWHCRCQHFRCRHCRCRYRCPPLKRGIHQRGTPFGRRLLHCAWFFLFDRQVPARQELE
jgi:hypothetical protein